MTNEPETNVETLCVGCGYDLRGLDAAGECPECATSIARSLAGERLVNADPAWVRRIVFGQRLAAFGLVGSVCGVLGIIAAGMFGGLAANVWDIEWAVPVAGVLAAILLIGAVFGGLIVACVGFFLVTSLDPRERERESLTSTRNLARWGMASAIALLMLGKLDALQTTAALTALASTATVLGLVALSVSIPSLLFCLAELTRRIPAPALAIRTTNLGKKIRKRMTILLILVVLRAGLSFAPAGTTVDRIANVIELLAGCGVAILVLLLLISLLTAFSTMTQLANAFKTLVVKPDQVDVPPSTD